MISNDQIKIGSLDLTGRISTESLHFYFKHGYDRSEYVSFHPDKMIEKAEKVEPTEETHIQSKESEYKLVKYVKICFKDFHIISEIEINWMNRAYESKKEDKAISCNLYYRSKDADKVINLLNEVKYFKEKEDLSGKKIEIIKSTSAGFDTMTIEIKETDLDYSNYNDDLKNFNDYTINKMQEDSGIVILHGNPGTGKTYYLRSLIKQLKDKRFIYFPAYMTHRLSDPTIIDFILSNNNSIFIIEDAEEVLKKSDTRNTAVSNILNFGDGLIGDAANINFIFTFNMDIAEIDPAIVRKGRLISKYEFNELESNKKSALCKKLGVSCNSGILADIYNANSEDYGKKEESLIGFTSS